MGDNKVVHSMKGQILAKTESGRYVVRPTDSFQIELVPFEKFHNKCTFPPEMLDENGLLKDGLILELVRVENGWLYPNHKIYKHI